MLQIGVVGSCGELCSFIPEKYAQAFCTIVCLGVGLDEFVHLLNTADLDPVYLCTETDACPKNSCTGAHCTSITKTWVTPAKAKLRSTFTFHAQVKASAATGSGLTVFGIRCPNCNKQGVIEMAALNEGFAAGSTHVINATLDTAEVRLRSASQRRCATLTAPAICAQDDWQYPIGTVQFEALSCLYGCQDKYGKIWSKAYGSFEIEQN